MEHKPCRISFCLLANSASMLISPAVKRICDKLQSLSEICRKSVLGYPDSNQERQDQNLQCYHYTIPQFLAPRNRFLDCGCKGNAFF